jgi:hypothetical protein
MGYRGGMPVRRRWLPPALALAVVAGGAFAAGCGGSEEGARPAAESTPTQEQTEADGSREDSDGTGQSNSITQRSDGSSQSSSIRQSGGSSSSSSSQRSSGGSGVSTFSGNGRTTLSFNAERPSRLVWTNNQGERFTIEGAGISVDSRQGRGEVRLDPGEYENLKVNGENWTLVVRPR